MIAIAIAFSICGLIWFGTTFKFTIFRFCVTPEMAKGIRSGGGEVGLPSWELPFPSRGWGLACLSSGGNCSSLFGVGLALPSYGWGGPFLLAFECSPFPLGVGVGPSWNGPFAMKAGLPSPSVNWLPSPPFLLGVVSWPSFSGWRSEKAPKSP